MLLYLVRRILVMIPTLLVVSALVFVIIQLPEGDYLSAHVAELEAQGERVSAEKIEFLRRQYGLDRTPVEQYFHWLFGMLEGDFGFSYEYNLPVSEIIGDRLFLSFLLSFATIVFTWMVAFPSASIPLPTSTASRTTRSPSSASSASPPPTFCSRWCFSTLPTSSSEPPSAGSWTRSTSTGR